MEKTISKQQMKVILQEAPKGSNGGRIVQALADKGYKIEGFNDQPEPEKTGTGSQISSAFNSGIEKTKQGLKEGVVNAQNPLQAIEGGLKAGAGIVEAVSSPLAPITAPVGKLIQKGTNAISDIPTVQQFAQTQTGQNVARGAEDISNLSTVAGAMVGLKTAPQTLNRVSSGFKKVVTPSESKLVANAVKENSKQLQKTIDLTGDVLNKEERIQAIKDGRGISSTTFDKGGIVAGEKDLQRANLVRDIIKSKDLNTNISLAGSEIKHLSENVVKPFLKENPNYYEPKDLVDYVNRTVQPTMAIKSNASAFKIFNQIKQKAISIAQKNPADIGGILEARKTLDTFIKKEFGDTVFQEAQSSAVKQAPIQARNAFNSFIEDSLKTKGNIAIVNKIEDLLSEAQKRGIKINNLGEAREILQKQYGLEVLPVDELKAGFFRYNMRKMSALYESIDNMATRAEQSLNTSKAEAKIKAFKKNNPIKSKAVNSAVRATVIGNLIP